MKGVDCEMNWRELIHQFLTACADDHRDRVLVGDATRRNKFIREFGSADLQQSETERIKASLEESEAGLGAPDEYRLVEEGPNQIVAEVDAGPNGQPHRLSRFRIGTSNGRLELIDFYWKCGLCADGSCKWCNGSGVCHMCEGVGKCEFCDGDPVCAMCKGERACSMCKTGEMPGWIRMSH